MPLKKTRKSRIKLIAEMKGIGKEITGVTQCKRIHDNQLWREIWSERIIAKKKKLAIKRMEFNLCKKLINLPDPKKRFMAKTFYGGEIVFLNKFGEFGECFHFVVYPSKKEHEKYPEIIKTLKEGEKDFVPQIVGESGILE